MRNEVIKENPLKQVFPTMKNILLFLLFVVWQLYPNNIYAQNAKVIISGNRLSVGDVLTQIEKQTDYLFVYNKRSVDVRRIVNIDVKDRTVAGVLDEVFKGTDIGYLMEGHNIVLTRNGNTDMPQSSITVSGVVKDKYGEPVIGANIRDKNATTGTVTGLHGNFTLETDANGELLISYIGYQSVSVHVNGKTSIYITMEEEALTLETVVVTAMGIEKKEASLTYSAQQISGDELVRTKDTNFINSLTGKSAGVQINRSSSGLGGSAKVSIRGGRSVAGNNQPLYVIDGVPMLNSTNEQAVTLIGGTADAGNRDGGDGISNLNPDDIESMSILKGASAAALYGIQAANGVILITTRKGKTGVQRATFSSNITFDKAVSLPEFQNSYGIDSNKASWGAKGELKDYGNTDDFFRGGVTTINSLSFTKGGESLQVYFSYSNTRAKGIIRGNSLARHNLNFRQTADFFKGRLELDGGVNLVQQTLKNRPTTGGYYMNPLVGLYGFPRGEDLGEYRDNFEVFDQSRNMPVQNWYTRISGFEQNPYWITNRILSDDKRYRTIANISASFRATDWLKLQARGTVDYIHDKYSQKMYASTAPDIAGTYTPDGSNKSYANGRYINMEHSELLIYGDVMAVFNKSWADWTLMGAAGASLNTTKVNSLRLDSKTASLLYPNMFVVSNMVLNSNAYVEEDIDRRSEIQSLFGTAQLGWKNSVYLDVTGRNDWASTLAYTNRESFFYPSVGLSWIFNRSLDMPSWVSLAKIRTSWSQVGNDLPLYYSKLQDHIQIGNGTSILNVDTAPFEELKPEISTSMEFGMEWRLFNQRIDLDFTLYKTGTRNQLLTLPASAGAEYKYYVVNAGKIENKGIELMLGGTPVLSENFRWKTGINYSTNKNKVIRLHPELNGFIYGDEGFSMNYAMRLVEGGSFGDIYGWKFDRDDNGSIKLNEKGMPVTVGSGNTIKVGNSNPDYMLGWNNTFTYKGLSLYFLIDARVGGDVLSQTQAELDYRGVSKNSAIARDKGYVEISGQKFTNVEDFYKHSSSRTSTITEYYMYDATNIRLRELSIAYSVPESLLSKIGVFKKIDLSLIGRNLFFFYKNAPFDPDMVMSTSNSCQGVDVFGMPATRSFGINMKFTF